MYIVKLHQELTKKEVAIAKAIARKIKHEKYIIKEAEAFRKLAGDGAYADIDYHYIKLEAYQECLQEVLWYNVRSNCNFDHYVCYCE